MDRKGLVVALVATAFMIGACALANYFISESDNSNTSTSKPTPTPTPNNAAAVAEARELFTETATEADLIKARDLLSAIPKAATEYAQAQSILKDVEQSLVDVRNLGPKPENSPYDGRVEAADAYLRSHLNDYDSSEYVEWSKVIKTTFGSEEYWAVKLKLRAKNAFGAYLLKDVIFYMQKGEVVNVIGL